jgi:Ca2+-binding RTX toxin-like protein
MANLTGTPGNDVIVGTSGDDVINGLAGNDQLGGGDGDDTLDGGDGSDSLDGYLGNDTLIGGEDVDYLQDNSGVNSLDGGAGNDFLYSFSNSAGQTLSGGDGNDYLFVSGGGTNSTLSGGDGDDTFQVYSAGNTLTGGTGSDTYRLPSTAGQTITDFAVGAGGDIIDVPNLVENAIGYSGPNPFASGHVRLVQSGADTLVQWDNDGAANGASFTTIATLTGITATDLTAANFGGYDPQGGILIQGTSGDDVLVGTSGNDIINGLAGNDTILGNGGNDTIDGGAGNDGLDGGSGNDTATYADAAGPVEVNLRFGFADEYNADESAILSTDSLYSIENVIGSAFNDALIGDDGDNILDGNGGDDLVQGGAGNDTLYGGAGNDVVQGDRGELYTGPSGYDTLYGGDGNDTLRGGLGNDTLYGGDGNDHFRGNEGVDSFDGGADDGEGFNGIGDRISFYEQRATQGAVADLRTGVISNDGFGNVESMTGIESLGGGTAYADTFYGNDGRNFLFGDRGDNVYGFGGDDLFQISSAPATLDGGSDTDTVYLISSGGWLTPDTNADGLAEVAAAATEGWFINLLGGTMFDGYGNFGTITGVENVTGSELADAIRGDDNNNLLLGMGGDDVVVGNGGDDTIDGGDGSDFLRGDAQNYIGGPFGNDILIGGAGDDHMRGGPGVDSFDGGTDSGGESIYGGIGDRISFFEMAATAGVIADLRTGIISNDGFGNVESMTGIESLGGDTAYVDTFYGNDGRNTLLGGRGDNLYGFGGDDNFSMAAAAATVDGGTGTDTLQVNSAGGWLLPDSDADGVAELAGPAAAGWTIDLSAGTIVDGYGNSGTVTGVENLDGSELDDTLIGDSNDNVLNGLDGNDTLQGNGGNDTLDGGNGTDTASYEDASGGVNVNLGASFANGADGNDTLISIENAIGSAFNDFLVGSNGDNILDGRGGNDTIIGQQGNDTLDGGDGDDVLQGGQGADALLGGAGGDNLTGNQGDDTIYGGDGGDALVGNPGNDTLYGGAGDDFLRGDNVDGLTPGDDYIDAGAGFDRVTYYNTNNAVTVSLLLQGTPQATGQGMDTLLNTEAISGSVFSDTLIGDNADNWFFIGGAGVDHHTVTSDTITANGGNDLIVAGYGNHILDGGTGTDTVGFTWVRTELSGGVTVSLLLQGASQDTGQGSMTISGIENLSGSTFDDTFYGDNGNNLLAGGAANDVLSGGAGNDVLLGDGEVNMDSTNVAGVGPIATFNSLDYAGVDFYDSTGNIVYLFEGQNLYDVGGNAIPRADLVDEDGTPYSQFELNGATYVLYVGDATASDGVTGNDILDGGDGDDTLIAGAGNDTLIGGAGYDSLDGGAGIDTVSYWSSAGAVAVDLQFGFADEYTSDGLTWLSSDTLTSIEYAIGSQFNDVLLGSTGDNYLDGADGDDIIRGRGGNDQIFGGAGNDDISGDFGTAVLTGGGNDNLDGGDGNDTVRGRDGNDIVLGGAGNDFVEGGTGNDIIDGGSGFDRAAFYSMATVGVHVDLNLQGVAQDTNQGIDTLIGIENVSGSQFGDTLIGDDNDNQLWGSPATLADGTVSAANNDTLIGNGGNDLLLVGIGNHSLTGGSGTDTVAFTENGVPETGLTISLALQGVAQATGNGSWTLNGIENLSGGTGGDNLTGDGNANVLAGDLGNDALVGGAGNDTLYGDGRIGTDFGGGPGTSGPIATFADVTSIDPSLVDGNDTLEGGLGDDNLYGGGGNDTASYAHAGGDVQAFLYNGTFGEAFGADGYDQLHDIENLTGSAFNDQLGGNNQANVLSGGDGHDSLRGNAGNDTLLGGNGDDFLNGGVGDDTIDGGAGYDRATYYTGATSGVTVNLTIVGPQATGQGNDTLIGIENVSGTAFADTLIGDGNDNQLWGSPGTLGDGSISAANNDTLDGGGGNDLLTVGIGNHSLTGGSGIDTVSFTENGNPEPGVTISLALQGAAQATGAGSWTLNGIENLSGGIANDSLTGDGSANVLAGDAGNDTLVGGAGNDTLYGDGRIATDSHGTGLSGPITTFAEVTTVDPSLVDGDDTLEGGLGNDTLNGGGGTDTATYAHASGAVTASLATNTSSGADGNDTFVSIENLTGSAFNDILTGNGVDNTLDGGDGHDKLSGGAGNDVLIGGNGDDSLTGGSGNDVYNGGGGYDRANFFGAATGVTVNLNLQNAAQNTGQGNDTLIGIENVSGTQFADTIIGDNNDNWLWGFASSTVPGSNANNDTIDGGGGNDLIWAGRGNQTLIGGSGIDTVMYNENFSSDVPVTISLALQGTAQDTGQGIWTLTGFENLGGGAAGDTLTGDGNANILAGGGGSDTLTGGAGNDTLYGDGEITFDDHGTGGSGPIITIADASAVFGFAGGNDTLEGGLGNDIIDGGAGIDTATYANASGIVTVNLNTGTATGADGNDTLVAIENVIGSAFADTITGDANANVLNGGNGNDTLDGRLGNDTLIGGAGIDTASYANAGGAVSVNLTLGTASGADGSDTLASIENVTGSAFADTITGDANANVLNGGDGDDTLNGRLGNDTLNGGNGIDTASYANASGAVTVNLNTGNASGADGTDTLTLVENVTGSQFADTITGDANANLLNAGDGNDTLLGGKGDDWLYGGRANDTLTGNQGVDRYVIETNSGSDHVTDFAVGTDKVLFQAVSGIDDFTDLMLTKVGNNTVITWGTGDSLTIDGIKPSLLHASDFEFSASAAAASTLEASRAEIGTGGFQATSFGADAFEHGTFAHEVPQII